MPQDFMTYWKPATADQGLADGWTCDHIAGNQFDRVKEDDTVWIVTIRFGDLRLLSNIKVGQVTDQDGASQALCTSDLWEAKYHILAKKGTAQEGLELSLYHLAAKLRFQSKSGKDRLTIKDDFIDAQQLQTLRLLTSESAASLRELWAENCETDFVIPEELPNQATLFEGAAHKILVNAYERNSIARRWCIEHWKAKCFVCRFDFEAVFGEIGKGFIHVHHIIPISQIGVGYAIDPVEDLRPLCPNCHAMIHRRNPPYSIDELKMIRGSLL